MVVSVAVVVIMITSVAIPILSSISDKETFNTGYDDQLRYSRISTDDDISISYSFVEDENHLYIDGVDCTYLVENRGSTKTPLIMSDIGWTFTYKNSNTGEFNFDTKYWNPETEQFDGFRGTNGTKEYSIEIKNGTITLTGFLNADGPHDFNYGYILDYDGSYGLYSSTGDVTSTIAANSDDYLIEYADHNVGYDLITAVNGSVSSQYGYDGTYSSEINATVDVTENDGVMNYTLPIKSTQSDKDTEYMTVGPISIIQGDLDPAMSSLISAIPLIMILGLVIAAVSAFITLKSRGGGA